MRIKSAWTPVGKSPTGRYATGRFVPKSARKRNRASGGCQVDTSQLETPDAFGVMIARIRANRAEFRAGGGLKAHRRDLRG